MGSQSLRFPQQCLESPSIGRKTYPEPQVDDPVPGPPGVGWSENGLPRDGQAYLFEHFLSQAQADELFLALMRNVAWEQRTIRLFGREIPQPRLIAWYGDPGCRYRYSGLTLEPRAWLPDLRALRMRVQASCSTEFNSALLNLYRDGRDSMGWHRDDEPELGPEIASVSLGATRGFRFQHARIKSARVTLPLHSGSLMWMRGETQLHWKHALPKQPGIHAARINITFRWVNPSI